MRKALSAALLLVCSAPCAFALTADIDILRHMGAQGVNFWRLQAADGRAKTRQSSANFAQVPLAGPHEPTLFLPFWFEQPVDHFAQDNSSAGTFKQRYWVNTRHYNATRGGPVFVLDGGETSGEDRLPFLDTGIMEILPKAAGGIGIILEHRYYGE